MHRLYSRIQGVSVYIFLLTAGSFSLSNFTNYQSVIRINDIVASGKKIWAASSGGLLLIDLAKHTQTFYCDNNSFPDLDLTALALDSKGNVWIGSKLGYLYKRSPDGRYTAFDSYFDVQWGIQDIFVYKDYLIVGSPKGLGIFDPVKGLSIRNTTAIDSSLNASINAIIVHNDSLYASCQSSYAAFDISGNKFLNSNYLDLTLWNPTYTGTPVVAFVDSSGTLLPQTAPAVMIGQTMYRSLRMSDSASAVTADSLEIRIAPASIVSGLNSNCTIPGAITVMTSDGDGNVWIGTDENFLFSWNATADPKQYKIAGLTNNFANRIYAAKNGTVWILPSLSPKPNSLPWWEGITSFDGKQWKIFNVFSAPGIGMFNGGGSDFTGICEDRNGNMWFGTSGSAARFYNSRTKEWQVFYFGGLQGLPFDSVKQISLADLRTGIYWSKHDAICQDSSGNLWVSNLIKNKAIKTGCLVCYNPWREKTPSCRRFFPVDDFYEITDIKAMCVDVANHLFVGGAGDMRDMRLLVIDPTASPIDNGIRVILDRSDLSSINGITSTPRGITWIATGSGLYKYISSFAGTDSALSHITSLKGLFKCVAAETESIIWLGTTDKGLVRYDADKDSAKIVDMTGGLVSNAINDIAVDQNAGCLWIGTSDGISKYSLGHFASPVTDNASIVAYPNPYSFSNSNHREIVFAHCAPAAKVFIYTMSGALVKQLSSPSDNAYAGDGNPFESTLRWIPSKKTPLGMYYFVGQSQKPVKTKKLLIVP